MLRASASGLNVSQLIGSRLGRFPDAAREALAVARAWAISVKAGALGLIGTDARAPTVWRWRSGRAMQRTAAALMDVWRAGSPLAVCGRRHTRADAGSRSAGAAPEDRPAFSLHFGAKPRDQVIRHRRPLNASRADLATAEAQPAGRPESRSGPARQGVRGLRARAAAYSRRDGRARRELVGREPDLPPIFLLERGKRVSRGYHGRGPVSVGVSRKTGYRSRRWRLTPWNRVAQRAWPVRRPDRCRRRGTGLLASICRKTR